jgi:hypothetical protein
MSATGRRQKLDRGEPPRSADDHVDTDRCDSDSLVAGGPERRLAAEEMGLKAP